MYCNTCDAVGESCCEASRERRATGVALARLVERQKAIIKAMQVALEAQRALMRGLMELNRVDK